LPVYNDGMVQTVTQSEYARGKDVQYIDTTSKVKKLLITGKNQDKVMVVPKPLYLKVPVTMSFRIEGEVHGVGYREELETVMRAVGINDYSIRNGYIDNKKCIEGLCSTIYTYNQMDLILRGAATPKALVTSVLFDVEISNENLEISTQMVRKFYPFDIQTRNRSYDPSRGKAGNIKYYNEIEFEVSGVPQIVKNDNNYLSVEVPPYNYPTELRDYTYVCGNYISSCPNPKKIKYLIDEGVKRYLVYMHSFDKDNKIYHVFKDSVSCQQMTKDIVK